MTVNREQAERAIVELLRAFGRDPATDPSLGLAPSLVVESWENDWLCGYDVDIGKLFATATPNDLSVATVVVVSNIATYTLCPHHLLPAEGQATVAYLPGQRLLGIGTLARLVDAYSRRFTLQEQIGTDVVAALMSHAGAKGAYCRLDLQHGCLRLRGAKQPEATVTTTCCAGVFASTAGRQELDAALRQRCEP
jgi:GTP cyclohydrolase I